MIFPHGEQIPGSILGIIGWSREVKAMNCNCKSLLITIGVAAVVVWGTDFLIHGIWLKPVYEATPQLWRSEAGMISKMPFMFAGQAVVAIAFTTIFALFVAEKRSLGATLLYALCVALLVGGGDVIRYAVQPYPGHLVVRWFLAGIVQTMFLGTVVHFVYRAP